VQASLTFFPGWRYWGIRRIAALVAELDCFPFAAPIPVEVANLGIDLSAAANQFHFYPLTVGVSHKPSLFALCCRYAGLVAKRSLRPPPLMPANCATLSLTRYGVPSDTWRQILAVTGAGAIAAIAVSQLAGSVATARHAI